MTARILHVIESMTPGGMETTFLNVLCTMRTLDSSHPPALTHDVLSFGPGALDGAYRSAADRLFVGSSREQLESALMNDYSVVHVLFDRCAHRLAPLLFRNGRSAVVYGKGYDISAMYRMQGGFDWLAEDAFLSACDAATFTTEPLSRLYRGRRNTTSVLEKAVDYQSFACIPAPDGSVPNRMICVANLHPRKRLGDLIAVLKGVQRRMPDAEAIVVGGGNRQESERLAFLAQSAGVGDVFILSGSSSDVAEQIAMARVMVLPSGCEGVPTSLLEAMSAGRPVIATRTGHVHSILTDGCEGFLVDIGDVEAMTDRAFRLLEDRELARQMGAAGRRRAANHNVLHVAARLFNVLTSAAAES